MEEKKYESDALQHPPSFDEMVGLIKKLFTDYLEDVMKTPPSQIADAWKRYSCLNHLYRDDKQYLPPLTEPVTDEDVKAREGEKKGVHDRIIANQLTGMSLEEAIYQTGYASGVEFEKKRHQPGAVWVKASEFEYEIGVAYHAKDTTSKGAGKFDKDGVFNWGDGSWTLLRDQHNLFILDESGQLNHAFGFIQNFQLSDIDAPVFTHTSDFRNHFDYIKSKFLEIIGNENEQPVEQKENEAVAFNKAQFDHLQKWLSDRLYTYDGEYYYDEDNNFYNPDQIFSEYQKQNKQ